MPTEEVKRQLLKCRATIAVTIEAFLPTVLCAKAECPEIKTIVLVSPNVQSGYLSFFDLIKTDPTGHEFCKGTDSNTLEDLAYLPFSSGTTGPPKGVMITHSNLTTLLNQYTTYPEVCVLQQLNSATGHQERMLGVLPFFHAYGFFGVLVVGTRLGAHILTLPKFEPQLFVRAIKRHRPTVMHLVTPLISLLTKSPDCTSADLEATHTIIGSAAPIGSGLIHKMLEKAGKYIFFQEGYGLTEMTAGTHLLYKTRRNDKIGSCGMVIPSTLCKVVHLETGTSLGPGEKVEICLKGPQMMTGYFGNEEATRNTIDPDGWLHTGDIGYYDENFDFYIVDRLKELNKVQGFQVSPSELEDLLRNYPGVADVAVIGIPDEEHGEVPRAYVVAKQPGKLTEENVQEYLREKAAPFKQLRGGVQFVKAIPKAPTGKILRRELLMAYRKEKGLK